MKTLRQKETISLNPFKHKRHTVEHWKDSKEMHRALRNFDGVFQAVLIELLGCPMSLQEIDETLNRMRGFDRRSIRKTRLNLADKLDKAVELKLLERRDGRYHLTPGGIESAEHMEEVIPAFLGLIFSPQISALVSVGIHVTLSILKLGTGFLSGSAGLVADGLDNTADTLSSFLVWLGLKFDKERAAAVFIIVTMVLSAGGAAHATLEKISRPEPIREGLLAFIVSGACGLLMLGLSSYQYLVGRKKNNLTILCQAVDSCNHFYMSMLVCGGISLSSLADLWGSPWLYYADAAASAAIGLLILRGAVELVIEMFRKEKGEIRVSHFMGTVRERRKNKIILEWLSDQLQTETSTLHELEKRFIVDFCEQTPKIISLTGLDYIPTEETNLKRCLERFEKKKKVLFEKNRYRLIAQ